MSERKDDKRPDGDPAEHSHAAPATQPIRTVGQRRRDAEEKLEHQLQDARHKDEPDRDEADQQQDVGAVDSSDVAAIQDDGALTAADRVDLIANQVVAKGENSEEKPV
ncbi:hypothetical protein [Arthrobacter globiformis]|uniref:hypothetical protein n=1 Tax=Arthrobacter globiformis TaxID=1665 RepID=UPI002790869D|nr:hypothetical protein [Arthrobacter globiformis]MDQ0618642.1 hypothetical protein [Arthrobacter globiformis]